MRITKDEKILKQKIDITPYQTVFERSPSAFALIHVFLIDGHTYSEVCGQKSKQWNTLYGEVAYTGKPVMTIEYGSEINRYVSIQCYQVAEGYCAVIVLDMNDQIEAEKKVNQEYQRKYELERQRMQHDSSLLIYAAFNLTKHEIIEIVRSERLKETNPISSQEELFQDICKYIVYEEQREAYYEASLMDTIERRYRQGKEEQIVEFQRKLPTGKVIWVRARFYVLEEPSSGDLFLYYTCNDIDQEKSMEIVMGYITDTDYDLLGSINFQDDSALLLYGKNSSRMGGQLGLQREENYTESLEWFVNHAVVPEEREQYRTQFFIEKVKTELARNKTYEILIHVLGQDGKRLTKQIRYANYDVNAQTCFFMQTDITQLVKEQERKQKELIAALEEAKRANQAKTTFLSRMSHDMRTPMNGVLGLAALMRDEVKDDKIKSDLEQLEVSGQYLLQLINDTLDMNKIEAGKLELNLQTTDSRAVFVNILANAEIMAKTKGIQLEVQLPDVPVEQWHPIMADAARLEQVIMNIVSNAIKFTPAGGTVQLIMESVSITQETVTDRYIIRDTGIGISEAFLPEIFQAFSQEGRMNTERENGTGLGMSIVKQLVDLMGGDISIQSKLGEGTTVTVLMSYAISHEMAQVENTLEYNLAALKGKRILLCEDHPLNAQIACRLLEKKGMLIEHAKDGQVGVEMFAKSVDGYYDAILMDVRMPVLDGMQATKEIRKLSRRDATQIPIIAMTANAYQEDVKECIDAGMDAHIAKPIEPEIMYDVLAKYLEK